MVIYILLLILFQLDYTEWNDWFWYTKYSSTLSF